MRPKVADEEGELHGELMMSQFKAQSDAVEVWGASVLGCIHGLEAAGFPPGEAAAFLADRGIASISAAGWYPQQPYLDLLREVSQRYGDEGLRAMARQVPDTSKFPPGIRTLEDILQTLDIAYQMNHRGGPIGHYACVPNGVREVTMECANPYGCAFDMGILDALIAHFSPKDSIAQIGHQPGRGCRKEGDPACTYLITW